MYAKATRGTTRRYTVSHLPLKAVLVHLDETMENKTIRRGVYDHYEIQHSANVKVICILEDHFIHVLRFLQVNRDPPPLGNHRSRHYTAEPLAASGPALSIPRQIYKGEARPRHTTRKRAESQRIGKHQGRAACL